MQVFVKLFYFHVWILYFGVVRILYFSAALILLNGVLYYNGKNFPKSLF